ncbi:MAG: response regulator [Candidatus Eisenbacteria bacterium]|nr:response regulator [Candidatus Eisenbacteria bacterium]MCC7140618.1 response regulator [Candidatus Eisenbacteria bacterium]
MTPSRRRNPLVLIVDPDADVRAALADFLVEAFRVEPAGSAREALSYLEEHTVDAVIAEAKLPDHYAPGFFLEIRRRLPRAILVATYPYGEDLEVQEPRLRHIVDFSLSKPFDIQRLESTLLDMIQRLNRSAQEGA